MIGRTKLVGMVPLVGIEETMAFWISGISTHDAHVLFFSSPLFLSSLPFPRRAIRYSWNKTKYQRLHNLMCTKSWRDTSASIAMKLFQERDFPPRPLQTLDALAPFRVKNENAPRLKNKMPREPYTSCSFCVSSLRCLHRHHVKSYGLSKMQVYLLGSRSPSNA